MTLKDVAIIGGGASGATAAFHLANRGRKICLLEKNLYSPSRNCGGGMSAAVQNWFPFDLNPIVSEIIKKVEFSWCLSDKVVAELSGAAPFWIVKRENLDSFLLDKAINTGCDLIKAFNVIKIEKSSKILKLATIS